MRFNSLLLLASCAITLALTGCGDSGGGGAAAPAVVTPPVVNTAEYNVGALLSQPEVTVSGTTATLSNGVGDFFYNPLHDANKRLVVTFYDKDTLGVNMMNTSYFNITGSGGPLITLTVLVNGVARQSFTSGDLRTHLGGGVNFEEYVYTNKSITLTPAEVISHPAITFQITGVPAHVGVWIGDDNAATPAPVAGPFVAGADGAVVAPLVPTANWIVTSAG